jgi:pteridine reductase
MTKRVALVTGAAKRVGKALALGLAERGFDIALHYNHSEEDALQNKMLIEKMGRKCLLLKGNWQNTTDMFAVIRQAKEQLGQIDLLVNNASIFNQVGFLETDVDLFNNNFAVHVRVPFFLISEFAKLCGNGNVINIIDTMIAKTSLDYFAYRLSKMALYDLTKLAAKALAPGIRVNAISPGSTSEPIDDPDSNYLEKRGNEVLLKLPGDPRYLLQGIDFFLANPFVTGECIFIDGGAHLEC